MSEPLQVNEAVELEVLFQAPNEAGEWGPLDPTDVTFLFVAPNGGTTSLSYSGGTIQRRGQGRYVVAQTPAQPGLWFYRWTATGAVADVQEGTIEVEGQWTAPASYRSVDALIAEVRAELGGLNQVGFADASITRLLNDGQALLQADRPQTERLVWADGADALELPDDLVRFGELRSVNPIPANDRHGKTLFFLDPARVRAGTALLHYYAQYPEMGDGQPCALRDPGATGCVAYATYRLCKRVVANRAVYERYSTQLSTNAVTPEDIERLAESHRQEFLDVKEALAFSDEEATAY